MTSSQNSVAYAIGETNTYYVVQKQYEKYAYRGFSPYATFGTWKKPHKPKIALTKFLFYVRTNKKNSP